MTGSNGKAMPSRICGVYKKEFTIIQLFLSSSVLIKIDLYKTKMPAFQKPDYYRSNQK